MAGERNTPDSRLGRGGLQPSASPRDTFVRPERQSGLLHLAESLKQLSPQLANVASLVQRNADDRADEQGAADASVADAQGQDERAGLAAGTINPAGSKRYKQAAQRQFARLAAFNYGSALNVFIDTQLQDETDLDRFQERVAEFTKTWEEENTDPDNAAFGRDYTPQAAVLRAQAIQQNSFGVGKRLRERTEREFGELVGAAVLAEFKGTQTEGRQERIASGVNILRQQAFNMGIRGSRVNEVLFDSFSSLATAEGAPELLEALRNVPTGPNSSVPFGDLVEYREKLALGIIEAHGAKNRLESLKINGNSSEAENVLREMNEELLAASRSGLDPSQINIDRFKERMNALDPEKVSQLEAHRQSFGRGFRAQTAPIVAADLRRRIYDPTHPMSLTDLYTEFEKGGMSAKDYDTARTKIESRDRIRGSGRQPARADTLMSEGRRTISLKVDASGEGMDADLARNTKGTLLLDFEEQAYEWLASDEAKDKNETEKRAYLRQLAIDLSAHLK